MSATTANCPACGAPIEFKIGSSIVVVCEYCNSAIARTDRDLANLGKVADLLDTRSALQVGTTGVFNGAPFVLTGRAQLRHAAGGVWDEWYAHFGGERWGWLAEAQGRFSMTFPLRVTGQQLVPPFEALRPGEAVSVPGSPNRFVVAETGVATAISGEGEIPWALAPGEQYRFADLSGEDDTFATLDYSEEPPLVFSGREASLADLGISANVDSFEARRKSVRVERLTCPRCGGPMDIKAPDRSLRATCPSCNALLDVNQGNLTYLSTLAALPRPPIPVGSEGNFPEGKFVVAGYVGRFCVVEGTKYPWDEYLLYNPQVGFRWLVCGDNHWTWVKPIPAGSVTGGEPGTPLGSFSRVVFREKPFKLFQAVVAYVEVVAGEFYWRVEAGEAAHSADYINPPEMVSRELSGSEINWSFGTHLDRTAVQTAFGFAEPPPAPHGVGPVQPNTIPRVFRAWAGLFTAAVLVFLVLAAMAPRRQVLRNTFTFPPLESKEATQTLFSEPFELKERQNLRVEVSAPVSNSWFYLEGDIVNEETGLIQSFSIPVEYYFGTDGGESWSEGGPGGEIFLSSLPAGRYTLRLEAQWGDELDASRKLPIRASVRMTQGVPRALHLVLLIFLLTIPALVLWIRRRAFETRRWSESSINAGEAPSAFDSDDDSDSGSTFDSDE